MTAPAVSIVIPTRDRAPLLPVTLASILDQECAASLEVVVVDNGSEDDTAEVLRAVTAGDPRVTAMHEPTIGRTHAILTGMRAATGPLLLFTDDDVVVEPGWVDAYVDFFGRHPEASLAGGPIIPIPASDAWPAWFSERAVVSLGMVLHDGERPLAAGEHVWGANMAARAELFRRVGLWQATLGVRGNVHPRADPGMNEDIELQYRAREHGVDVWFCPGARIGHRAEPRAPGWCLQRGFVNGRNSFHRPPWPGMPTERRRDPSVSAGIAWAVGLARLGATALAFRVARDRRRFEAAWLASWSSGWRMEDLVRDRNGRQGDRGLVDRAVRLVTGRVAGGAVRLAGTS